MHPSGSPVPWLAVSLALGIFSAWHFGISTGQCLYILTGSLLLLALAYRVKGLPQHAFLFLSAGASFCLGMYALSGRLPDNIPGHYLHFTESGEAVLQIRIRETLAPTGYYWRWTGRVERVGEQKTAGAILVQIPRTLPFPNWQPSDRILTTARPQALPIPANPHQFDYGAYLRSIGIAAILRPDKGGYGLLPRRRGRIAEEAGRLRAFLGNRLEQAGLPEGSQAMVRALALGERGGLDPGLYAAYKNAGAVHLLAVSGLHVGILLAIFGWLTRPLQHLNGGRYWRFGISLGLLWGYALLTGMSPSVVRAATMFSLISYALFLGRPGDSPHFLALAALIMLGLIEPRWLLQAGFQMSMAAVWAILTFYPHLMRLWPVQSGITAKVGQLLGVSVAAQLGVLPISLFYFHQFPVLFWLSNLVLVPLMGLLLVTGFLLLILAAAGGVPAWVATGAGLLFENFNRVVLWFGGSQRFLLTDIPWDRVQLCLAFVALGLLGQGLATRRIRHMGYSACALLALELWTVGADVASQSRQQWWVPHRVGASALMIRKGRQLAVFTRNPEAFAGIVQDLKTGERIRHIGLDSLGNHYRLGSGRLQVIDSSGFYSAVLPHAHYLLLTGSPPAEPRLALQALRPGVVIADGSNYTSTVVRWEEACRELGIAFHSTLNKGAFTASLGPGVSVRSPSTVSSTGQIPVQ